MISAALKGDLTIFQFNIDIIDERLGQFALWALDSNLIRRDVNRHPSGDGNWKTSDARHLSPLPDVADDLTTDTRLPSLAIREDPAGGGENGDSQAITDPWDIALSDVDPSTGLADAHKPPNDPLLILIILEENLDLPLHWMSLFHIPLDEPLVLEEAYKRPLQVGVGDHRCRVTRHLSVADSSE